MSNVSRLTRTLIFGVGDAKLGNEAKSPASAGGIQLGKLLYPANSNRIEVSVYIKEDV